MKKIKYWYVIAVLLAVCLVAWVILMFSLPDPEEVFSQLEQYSPPTPCTLWECRPNPSSSQIAFSSTRFGNNRQLYVMNTDGTCVTQLTDFSNFLWDRKLLQPSWSPKDNKILFELGGTSATDLYLINYDGTDLKQLTNGGKNCEVQWSPDGTKIAFKSNHSESTNLYLMNSHGLDKKQLVDIPTTECNTASTPQKRDYSWSPDGTRIAFTGRHPTETHWEVYLADAENGELTNLTQHPGSDEFVTWWPEADKIIFTSDRVVDTGQEAPLISLYAMNIDGTDVQRLFDLSPIPAPTGYENRYYVHGWTLDPTLKLIVSERIGPRIYLIDPKCTLKTPSEPMKLPEICYDSFSEPEEIWKNNFSGTVLDIYWSSDNPQLAFRVRDTGRTTDEVVVTDYNGTNAVNLTSCSANDEYPAWSSSRK